MKKLIILICTLLISCSLSGCSVGSYNKAVKEIENGNYKNATKLLRKDIGNDAIESYLYIYLRNFEDVYYASDWDKISNKAKKTINNKDFAYYYALSLFNYDNVDVENALNFLTMYLSDENSKKSKFDEAKTLQKEIVDTVSVDLGVISMDNYSAKKYMENAIKNCYEEFEMISDVNKEFNNKLLYWSHVEDGKTYFTKITFKDGDFVKSNGEKDTISSWSSDGPTWKCTVNNHTTENYVLKHTIEGLGNVYFVMETINVDRLSWFYHYEQIIFDFLPEKSGKNYEFESYHDNLKLDEKPKAYSQDENKGNKNKCSSCGRSWDSSDSTGNYTSISKSHLCNNCHDNFETVTEALKKTK